MIIARFDGGCVPNPRGHASCACLIECDGEELYRKSIYLGHGEGQTCNVSEYEGVLLILLWIDANYDNRSVTIIGDSQVVVNRLKYSARPAGGVSAEIANRARREYQRQIGMGRDIRVKWERRGSNDECDAMCDLEIAEARHAEMVA